MKLPALYVISLIFCALLFARAAAVTSEAIGTKAVAETAAAETQDGAALDGKMAREAPSQCLTGDVLDVLQADQKKLTERFAAISAREQTLATLEAKLSDQMIQIEAANKALEARIDMMKTVANDDIAHLVKMYEIMKPKQAAEIFNSMDPAFAAGFLRQMDGERAGMIMANMESRKSYAVSVIMASKNAKYR